MTYLPELYYFIDRQDFPRKKAILITAKTVGQWCDEFRLELISPNKRIREPKQAGELNGSLAERGIRVASWVQWIFDNSDNPECFSLILTDKITPDESLITKFHHPDDSLSWRLNLSEAAFLELQSVWRKNNLPDDLFYASDQGMCLVQRPSIFNRMFGIEKNNYYSPKRWEALPHEKRSKILARSR